LDFILFATYFGVPTGQIICKVVQCKLDRHAHLLHEAFCNVEWRRRIRVTVGGYADKAISAYDIRQKINLIMYSDILRICATHASVSMAS